MNDPEPAAHHAATGAEATRALAARFATALLGSPVAARQSLLVTLSGELGAGKTTFVGGMLRQFGHDGPVRSPTYTLVEPYRLAQRDIHHCDLYRLRHPDELEELGLRDLRRPGAILLVEWPERAEGRLGTADIEVRLTYRGPEARDVDFKARSDAGRDVVVRL